MLRLPSERASGGLPRFSPPCCSLCPRVPTLSAMVSASKRAGAELVRCRPQGSTPATRGGHWQACSHARAAQAPRRLLPSTSSSARRLHSSLTPEGVAPRRSAALLPACRRLSIEARATRTPGAMTAVATNNEPVILKQRQAVRPQLASKSWQPPVVLGLAGEECKGDCTREDPGVGGNSTLVTPSKLSSLSGDSGSSWRGVSVGVCKSSDLPARGHVNPFARATAICTRRQW
mmetsp:Transcript_72042/g.166888  ORF Transcript_72042/g.166888 Transcript_72042/m.166888 type:complete len:233 (-) Transcript_72042:17-715(-)